MKQGMEETARTARLRHDRWEQRKREKHDDVYSPKSRERTRVGGGTLVNNRGMYKTVLPYEGIDHTLTHWGETSTNPKRE
jgi:hypothetical protein